MSSPQKDNTKTYKANSSEGDSINKLSTTAKTVTICTTSDQVEKCSTAYDPSNPYQQNDELINTSEQESIPQNRSLASEVFEKARTRFDMFWGKNKPNPEDSNH